jgi:cyclopropane-fatty-acyl-phospholipid synthase
MILARLLSKIFKRKEGVILIDSDGQKYICGNPRKENPITVKLLRKDLNMKIVLNPELAFPEAYMRGEIIFENSSLYEFLNLTFENLGRTEINIFGASIKNFLHFWRFISNYNFPGKSKKNIQYHYDIGEKLYDLFLDKKHRQYSCAYFKNNNETIEEAQQNKLNHIIKKLGLKPNQKVLDIGCGWGGLAFEIARQSGCEVTGISLSENQIEYCKKKAKKLNLDNQVNFELCDYRHIIGKFNRVVSVGAFEHFDKKFYGIFFKKIKNILTDDGLALLHTIGSVDSPGPIQPFIQKYIFPGGIVPSMSDMVKPIEKSGLIISDSETLIHHYNKTLDVWLERFLENRKQAKELYDEKFCKMWEFYLASCSAAFKFRDLVVYQLQLVKNFKSIPQNRRDYIYF